MPKPQQPTQGEMRRSIATEGFTGVTTAMAWFEAGHFENAMEARGAFKLAYQQGLDGMGTFVSDWMGLTTEQYNEWMAHDRLPSDHSAPVDGRSRVYFVRSGEHVKVGTSTDVSARIASLQTGSANRLEVLLAVPGDASLERAIHRQLEAIRVREDGEWFHATPDLLAFIEGLRFAEQIAVLAREQDDAHGQESHR